MAGIRQIKEFLNDSVVGSGAALPTENLVVGQHFTVTDAGGVGIDRTYVYESGAEGLDWYQIDSN